jgi:hypothetical protein
MKVFIITARSWNGRASFEGSSEDVSNTGEAFFNEEEARRVVNERNKARGNSTYEIEYDFEEVEVQ